MTREIIADLFEFMLQLDARIKAFDSRIDQVFRANPDCQRIAQICDVGSKTATAVRAFAPPKRRCLAFAKHS